MALLMRYSETPGAAAVAPVAWPREWSMRPDARGVTLVIALHPRCSCSHATLGELAEVMSRGASGVHAYVLMLRPDGTPDGFERGALWREAAAIPFVTVLADPGGELAARLGAQTSGQTYAFDSSGRLLFAGGITPARGDMGDCAGADALSAILMRENPQTTRTVVFGCPLKERQP
jgi:hypothetical protein